MDKTRDEELMEEICYPTVSPLAHGVCKITKADGTVVYVKPEDSKPKYRLSSGGRRRY